MAKRAQHAETRLGSHDDLWSPPTQAQMQDDFDEYRSRIRVSEDDVRLWIAFWVACSCVIVPHIGLALVLFSIGEGLERLPGLRTNCEPPLIVWLKRPIGDTLTHIFGWRE